MPQDTMRIALLAVMLSSGSGFKPLSSSVRVLRNERKRLIILKAGQNSKVPNEMGDADEPRGVPSKEDSIETEEIMYTFSQLKALGASSPLSLNDTEGDVKSPGALASGSVDIPATSAEIALERDLVSRPFSPLDLLVQRAIQTQLFYCNDLRNEPLAAWLKKFQDHDHLTGVPLRDSWHACLGLRLPAQDYLEALIRAEPYTYTVCFHTCLRIA